MILIYRGLDGKLYAANDHTDGLNALTIINQKIQKIISKYDGEEGHDGGHIDNISQPERET